MKHIILTLSFFLLLVSCNDANFYKEKAKKLMIAQEFSESEFYAKKAIAMEPDSIDNYIVLMLALDYLKNFDKEIVVLNKIIELKESSGKNPFKYYFQRANVYVETENCVEALKDINYLIDNSKTDFYKEALGDLEDLTSANETESNIFELYTSKATCLYRLGKDIEALEAINHALYANNKDVESLTIKSTILMSLKRYNEAKNILNQLIKIIPKSASTYLNLGYAYKELNKNEEAILCINKAMQLDSNLQDSIADIIQNFKRVNKP